MNSQTLVIGLDGATFDVIRPLIEAGRLPNLARLKAEGVWGALRSVMPPESAPAWSSFLTGTTPGQHGVLGFTRRMPKSYEWQVNTSNDCSAPTLAEILGAQGRRVGLFNIPLTYPPHPTNGFVISGMGTPGLHSDFTHPPELKKELLARFGKDTWVEEGVGQKTPPEYLRALHRSIDRTLQIGEFLLQRFPTLDLYVIVFMASDRVQHFYWNYTDPQYPGYVTDASGELGEAINGIYEHLDQAVGQLVAGKENWNIVVMSDHGGGPFYRMVNLNLWLEKEGYLELYDMRPTSPRKANLRYLKPLYRLFRQHIAPRMNHLQKTGMRKLVPQRVRKALRGYRHHPTLSRANWSRTQAYAEGTYGRIFLNVAGREPLGIVLPENRQILLNEISTKLLALQDPLTGERAVERVFQRDELFQGPFFEQAPDLFIMWRNWHYHVRDSFRKAATVFSDPPPWRSSKLRHTGNHRPDGIVLMKGQAISKGRQIEKAQITDLAPTLLYLLEANIPETMDGQVLMQAIKPQVQARLSPSYAPPTTSKTRHRGEKYAEEEEAAIQKRLRELGYID